MESAVVKIKGLAPMTMSIASSTVETEESAPVGFVSTTVVSRFFLFYLPVFELIFKILTNAALSKTISAIGITRRSRAKIQNGSPKTNKTS